MARQKKPVHRVQMTEFVNRRLLPFIGSNHIPKVT